MEITSSDIIITLIAIGVSVTVVYLFVKASGGLGNKEKKTELDKPIAEPIKAENVQPQQELKEVEESLVKRLEHFPRHLTPNEVEKAKSDLKILTLKKELLGAVIKRLFEAEDSGEISKDERIRLSKDYEDEMKKISEDLKKAELIITLNELETLREEIVRRYESTLNKTQSRIDSILKELRLEEHKPEALPKRKLVKKEAETEEEKPEKEVIEEAAEAPKKAKSDVEERLEQLRKDVLKELEELEKLEIES